MGAEANILYQNDVFPPSGHVVGRERQRESYVEYLEEHRLLPLVGAPGCGLKSMAAYIGAHYQQLGIETFWFTFRREDREQAEGLLWRSSVLLANQDQVDFQKFLRQDLRLLRPFPMGFKLAYWLYELRLCRTLLVFDVTQVEGSTPFLRSLLREIGDQFRYGTETLARVVLVGYNLPFDLVVPGLPELGGLSFEGCRTFFDRLGVQPNEDLLSDLSRYTRGYPRFLQAYAEMAARFRDRGKPWPEPSRMAEYLWLRWYVYSRYDLVDSESRVARLMEALSILRQPIDHHDFRTRVLLQRELSDGYHLTQLVARHRVLTDDLGGAISLHPVVRDVIAGGVKEGDQARFHELHSRAAAYYESKGDERLANYHREKLID